jgi:hypothetical protein
MAIRRSFPPKDFALSVTCDIEGTIWIVSTDYGPRGNVIKYYQGFPSKQAAQATQIFVQIYNFVVFLNNDGATGFLDGTKNNQVRLCSTPNMALALGISGANFWWVVSTDVDPQTGGNFLKWWDGGGTGGSNWKTTTPPLSGIAVGPR